MPIKKPARFFLDVCILLPQRLNISAKSCEDFLKKTGKSCCISSSVCSRVSKMLDYAYDWVAREIQENFYPYLKKHEIDKLTARDARVFESFFNERRRRLAKFRSPAMYFEILGRIELWAVPRIHSIKLGKKIKAEIFLTALLSELSEVYESLKAPLDAIEVKDITPIEEIRSHVALQGIHKFEDINHLASAVQFQFTNNEWVIFVTYDEKHILSQQRRLLEVCALHCCKPHYASDYARELSRQDTPIQYYASITPKSSKQTSFAKTIETSLGVPIS